MEMFPRVETTKAKVLFIVLNCCPQKIKVNFTQTIEKNTNRVSVSGVKTNALVDTGANISCVTIHFCPKPIWSMID